MKHMTMIDNLAEEKCLVPHIALALQAFAEPNTVVTSSADDTGSGSNIKESMRTYYHRVFLENARPNLVHEQFATKYTIPAGSGRTINMRRMEKFPKPAVNAPLTEGVAPDGGTLRVDAVTCGVDQFGYYVSISDMVDLTAADPLLELAMEELGAQGADLRDRYVRNKMSATTNVSFVPKAGGAVVTAKASIDNTCLMTLSAIRTAVTKMKDNNVKPFEDGLYVCIMHPNVLHDLRSSADFKDWQAYTEAGVKKMHNGEIGYIEKVRFVESTNALIERVGTDTTHAVYHSFLLGRGGYGTTSVDGRGLETVIKSFEQAGGPLNQSMTAGWKTVVGARVTNDEAVLDLMSGSSYDDAAAN